MSESPAMTDELRKALAAEEGGQRWLRRGIVVLVVSLAVGGGLLWRAKHRPAPPAKFVTAEVAMGDVVEKVQATGTVQPLLQVNIGAQVSGRVANVYVDFNSIVKKGALLAEIDPVQYGSQVTQAQANLSSQKAQISSLKANAETARINYERIARLHAQNLAAQAELDTSKGQYDVALANIAAAEAAAGAIKAQLSQSQTNVGWTRIYSPIDGVVVTRAIDPGATVVASFQTPTLFVIAQDLRKMRVLADVDEADVGKLAEKMEAEAVVDAFPGESFKGVVQQIRYSPNNVQGVVTYSAVVEVDNPDEKLRPGMTATVTVKTRERKNVLSLPNAALRYKPTPPPGPDGKPGPQPTLPALARGQGRVYVMTSDKPGEEKSDARVLAIGVTDGIRTELMPGTLDVGTKIVTDENDDDPKKKSKLF
ncbi:MAG: efflux RND transporter periplasmic adaptor subunit [Polyangiaceae bacterium]